MQPYFTSINFIMLLYVIYNQNTITIQIFDTLAPTVVFARRFPSAFCFYFDCGHRL